MKKILSLLLFLPLLSFIVACEENADVRGYMEGQNPEDAYDETYLYYYVRDDSPRGYSLDDPQVTALSYDFENDLLITQDMRTKKLNIKGYGTLLVTSQ